MDRTWVSDDDISLSLYMMEADLLQYEYTEQDSPASDCLVINMDSALNSGEACAVNERNAQRNPTTLAFDQLPSFDVFNTNSNALRSLWYKLPSQDNSETLQDGNEHTLNQFSRGEPNVTEDKMRSSDRTFNMESILGNDMSSNAYRLSPPTKNASTIPVHHRQSESSSSNPMLALQSQSDRISEDSGKSFNRVKKVYRRQTDKPPYSYVAMVVAAILTSEEKELTLAGIREKLSYMFPFFRGEYTGWKNSVRHVLSHSKCFYKVDRLDEEDTSNVSAWRVNLALVKPNTFNRHSKGLDYERYKLTLQEELGLPPFGLTDGNKTGCKDDILLPSKPCYQSELEPLVGGSDDFLNGRNDIVPTPVNTVSEYDSVQAVSVKDAKPSRKRKHTEEIHPTETTVPHKQVYMPSSVATAPLYARQYSQSNESAHPYDPTLTYYPACLSSVSQMSYDPINYCYPQQTTAFAQPWNFWGNNDEYSLRNWWSCENMYHGMGTSSFQSSHYPSISGWFPSSYGVTEEPLNLSKTVNIET